MAAIDTTRPTAALSAGNVTKFFGSAMAVFSDWNDARITRNSLSQLTARELDDIGLVAGDIDAIARRSFR